MRGWCQGNSNRALLACLQGQTFLILSWSEYEGWRLLGPGMQNHTEAFQRDYLPKDPGSYYLHLFFRMYMSIYPRCGHSLDSGPQQISKNIIPSTGQQQPRKSWPSADEELKRESLESQNLLIREILPCRGHCAQTWAYVLMPLSPWTGNNISRCKPWNSDAHPWVLRLYGKDGRETSSPSFQRLYTTDSLWQVNSGVDWLYPQFVKWDSWVVRIRWNQEGGSHGGISCFSSRTELTHLLSHLWYLVPCCFEKKAHNQMLTVFLDSQPPDKPNEPLSIKHLVSCIL